MSTIADKLQELINSKADMKSAIVEKGVEVEGGLTTYAAAIRKIQQWAGDRFAAIGYNGENTGGFIQVMDADIEVSKRLLDEWNSIGYVSMSKWKDDTVYFPVVDLTMKPSNMNISFKYWSKLQVVPSLDFTRRTSMNGLFYRCKSLKYIGNITGTESVTDTNYMFDGCSSLTTIPQLNTSSVSSMEYMFRDCASLTTVPQMDTSRVSSMRGMFDGCSSLTTVPQLNTISATNLSGMFSGCSSLTTVSQMDTSSATNLSLMFNGCSSLTTVPQLNTSSATNLSGMFSGCSSLTTVPQLNTSSALSMSMMFSSCSSLTTVPQMDTSSVTSMDGMFQYCTSLTTVSQMDTSSVTEMGRMFTSCESLTSIPLLDCSSITNATAPFVFSSNLYNLTDLGGFKNLKVNWSIGFLNMIANLTVESLMNVINNLYDLTANGLSGKTLNFGTHNLNKLTDEQIAVAINKGWTLI